MRGSEMTVADAGTTPWLAARGLVAGYLPGIDILRGVSVDAMRGQVRCVLGPNGTGKSTLLKVLFGFLRARAAEITFAGRPGRGIPAPETGRPRCASSPHPPTIFPHLSLPAPLPL